MGLFTKKYKIVFIRKQFNALFIVKIISADKLSGIVSFSNKTFSVNVENPAYIDKNMSKVYFFNYDSGNQMSFTETPSPLNPDELDMVLSQKLLQQLTAGVLDNMKDRIMLIIIGAVFGAMITALFLTNYYNSKIQEMLESYAVPVDPVVIVQSFKTLRMLM